MRNLFAMFLRPFRVALGYTQAQAALAADVTEAQWERWDNGRNNPRADSYHRLAKGLGYPTYEEFLKDFVRFASEHIEFITNPWTEAMGIPIFSPTFGLKATGAALAGARAKSEHLATESLLDKVVERVMRVNLDAIPSKARREELGRSQRSLLQRAAILQDDVSQFQSAATRRRRFPTKD